LDQPDTILDMLQPEPLDSLRLENLVSLEKTDVTSPQPTSTVRTSSLKTETERDETIRRMIWPGKVRSTLEVSRRFRNEPTPFLGEPSETIVYETRHPNAQSSASDRLDRQSLARHRSIGPTFRTRCFEERTSRLW